MVFDEDTQNPQGRQASQKVRLTQAFELGGGGEHHFLPKIKNLFPKRNDKTGKKKHLVTQLTMYTYLCIYTLINKRSSDCEERGRDFNYV